MSQRIIPPARAADSTTGASEGPRSDGAAEVASTDGGGARNEDLRVLYEQLCQSYRAIDDFRSKLLGFLPFVTGAGVLTLLGPLKDEDSALLTPAGAFGFFATLGLFAFEIHGIRKCHALINAGRRIEARLKMATFGQFCSRPRFFLDEPFASGVIYSTASATWAYIAWQNLWLSIGWGAASFVGMLLYAKLWLPAMEPPADCGNGTAPGGRWRVWLDRWRRQPREGGAEPPDSLSATTAA